MNSSVGGSVERPVFSPEFYRELASENPFGLSLHWREAEAWFHHIAWPAYKTYNYKRHHQTVRRWWARCSVQDLERARDAMENVKLERAQTEQDALPTEEIDFTTPPATLRKILGGNRGDGTE